MRAELSEWSGGYFLVAQSEWNWIRFPATPDIVSWHRRLKGTLAISSVPLQITAGGQEWNYIASQGPLSNTCQDFWQMVWEQGVSIIAMVTAEEVRPSALHTSHTLHTRKHTPRGTDGPACRPLQERGREKSFRYWPRLGSRHNTVTYGRFKITTRFRTESGCYATTGLRIKHLLTGQERTVWHLQYTDWPDHGCPDDLKGFLSQFWLLFCLSLFLFFSVLSSCILYEDA